MEHVSLNIVVQHFFPVKDSSPSIILIMGGSFGTGVLVYMIIVSIVVGIIYKRGGFGGRSECLGLV